MTLTETYDNAFIETFAVSKDSLSTLKYQDVPDWDSVGHMSLMATLEEYFSIEMDIDDIIEFSSYETGKVILSKYGIEL
jgi:acyl carrier protein